MEIGNNIEPRMEQCIRLITRK